MYMFDIYIFQAFFFTTETLTFKKMIFLILCQKTDEIRQKNDIPPGARVSAQLGRMTYCYLVAGLLERPHVSCDRRGDECINQIPCCAGSDRRRGAEWMHDWLPASPWCRSVFLCICMERLSVFCGCSNVTFLHVGCSALHTLNKHHYDVITNATVIVRRISKIIHSKVPEKKENRSNSSINWYFWRWIQLKCLLEDDTYNLFWIICFSILEMEAEDI